LPFWPCALTNINVRLTDMKSQHKKKPVITIGAAKLRIWRESKGMTLEDVASRLDVSRQAVSYWEMGDTIPSLAHIKELTIIADIAFLDWLKEA